MPTRTVRWGLPLLIASAVTTLGCARRGMVLSGPVGLIGLALLVFQIWAIVEIIQSARDTVGKVIWILVVLLVPLIGVICWFVFGRR